MRRNLQAMVAFFVWQIVISIILFYKSIYIIICIDIHILVVKYYTPIQQVGGILLFFVLYIRCHLTFIIFQMNHFTWLNTKPWLHLLNWLRNWYWICRTLNLIKCTEQLTEIFFYKNTLLLVIIHHHNFNSMISQMSLKMSCGRIFL